MKLDLVFKECRECASRPGITILCPSCRNNRAVISILENEVRLNKIKCKGNYSRDGHEDFFDSFGDMKMTVWFGDYEGKTEDVFTVEEFYRAILSRLKADFYSKVISD